MLKKTSFLTVGICTKNSEATIAKTLESIASQDFPLKNVDIIIVDGGSKDGTLKTINGFLKKTNIKGRIFFDEGAGLGSARQIILDNVRGEYILWLDSDVVLAPDFINQQLSFLEKRPRAGLVRGKAYFTESRALIADIQNLLFCSIDVVYLGATIGRVEALRQVGGFDKRIKGASEDVDIKIRLFMHNWIYLINERAIFFHTPKNTLRNIFKQYSWYGHGEHFLHHKYSGFLKIPYRLPPIFFGWGLKVSKRSYKNNYKKKSFLVPLLCLFIGVCWCLGFLKAHIEGYGHSIKRPEIKLFTSKRLHKNE